MRTTGETWATRLCGVSMALALLMVFVPAVVAQAQTFTVLYNFTGADGGAPQAGLIRDSSGNLYGTTEGGGSGYGVVFELTATGTYTVLHEFCTVRYCTDGEYPFAGLVRDAAGNLYGTTYAGGTSNACGDSGCGTVFKVNKHGKESVLYSFTGEPDGAAPDAGLVQDAAGNLYGTTVEGGAYGSGTVFKLSKTGKETVLYSFTGTGGDGARPCAGLVRAAAGNVYGTTYAGGTGQCDDNGLMGCGTVFKLSKTGKETVLYSFAGTGDGAYPYAGLVRDAAGNLYGATYDSEGGEGYGVVFKLDETGTETVLHSFTDEPDGAYPYAETLVRDAKGDLYGTTFGGGSGYCESYIGCGVVFAVTATGTETVLYTFPEDGGDGANPIAGLVRDAKGNLYGTTWLGGAYGVGVVFKLTP